MKYKTNSEVLDYLEDNVKHGEVSIDSSNNKLIVTCVVRSAFRDPSIYTRVKAFLRNNGFITDFNGTHTRYYNEKNEVITGSEYYYNKLGENSSVSTMIANFFNKPSQPQNDNNRLVKENEDLKNELYSLKNELYGLKMKNNELIIKLSEIESGKIKEDKELEKVRKNRDNIIERVIGSIRKNIPQDKIETNDEVIETNDEVIETNDEVIETNIIELLTKMKSGCRVISVKKYYYSLPKIKTLIEENPHLIDSKIVNDYKLSSTLFSALKKLNIIEYHNKSKIWIGGEVTIEMCINILVEISNQCRLSRGNSKKQKVVEDNQVSDKVQLINEETEINYTLNEVTEILSNIGSRALPSNVLRYFNILKELKIEMSNNPNISMFYFTNKNNITKNLSTILRNLNIIKLKNGAWDWIGGEVSILMVNDILQGASKLNPPRKIIKEIGEIKTDDVEITSEVFSEDEFELILNTFK